MVSTRSYASASPARLLALAATLTAAGCAVGIAESLLLPPLPVPGVRLGLANIAVVLALALLGPGRALAVSLVRVAVVGLATASLGGPASLMALAGALASWAVMAALAARGNVFSPMGWSVAGASAHVIAQLGTACLLVGSGAPLALTPLSLALGLGCGLAVGYAASLLLSRLPLSMSVSVGPGEADGTQTALERRGA